MCVCLFQPPVATWSFVCLSVRECVFLCFCVSLVYRSMGVAGEAGSLRLRNEINQSTLGTEWNDGMDGRTASNIKATT